MDVSNIDGSADGVTVSGMVFGLSPVKTSPKNMKFFNAKVGDGKKTVRMVCFDPALHSQFLKCESERSAMSM